MIDITGINKTPVYTICVLRQGLIQEIRKEVTRLDYKAGSQTVKWLSRLLELENRQLQRLWKNTWET